MDQVIEVFFSAQTLLLCLGVYVMTYVVRRVVETIVPGLQMNRYWREIFLPLGPIANGALLGLVMKTFVFPDLVNGSLSGRIVYGSVCGLFSAFMYNRVRSWLASKGDVVGVLPEPAPEEFPMTAEAPKEPEAQSEAPKE